MNGENCGRDLEHCVRLPNDVEEFIRRLETIGRERFVRLQKHAMQLTGEQNLHRESIAQRRASLSSDWHQLNDSTGLRKHMPASARETHSFD